VSCNIYEEWINAATWPGKERLQKSACNGRFVRERTGKKSPDGQNELGKEQGMLESGSSIEGEKAPLNFSKNQPLLSQWKNTRWSAKRWPMRGKHLVRFTNHE